MQFRFSLPLEIDQPGAELSSARKVSVQLAYEHGRWQGRCQDPPVATHYCDTLEESLTAAAREVQREWSRDAQAQSAGP